MTRKHDWKFLPPRVPIRRPANPSTSPAPRPPLNQLEALEDRLLLSTSDGGGTDQVLIGLLRSQLNLRNGELDVLKILEGAVGDKANSDVFVKIEDTLVKLDQAVIKIAEDSFLGHKVDEELAKVNEILVKLDEEVKLFGDGSENLLPAVQRLAKSAQSAIDAALLLPAVQDAQHKEFVDFLKIEDAFIKMNIITDKIATAEVIGDIKGESTDDKHKELFIIKIDDAFLKLDGAIAGFADGSVFKALTEDLNSYKANVLDFLDLNQSPGDTIT